MCLSVPIIFTRLTGKHSSAPIGIDPMQSLKERKAVAFSPAIKESDMTIANTQLYHRYPDAMEKTKGDLSESNLVFMIPSINNKYLILFPRIPIPLLPLLTYVKTRGVSKIVIRRLGERERKVLSVRSDQSIDTRCKGSWI